MFLMSLDDLHVASFEIWPMKRRMFRRSTGRRGFCPLPAACDLKALELTLLRVSRVRCAAACQPAGIGQNITGNKASRLPPKPYQRSWLNRSVGS